MIFDSHFKSVVLELLVNLQETISNVGFDNTN